MCQAVRLALWLSQDNDYSAHVYYHHTGLCANNGVKYCIAERYSILKQFIVSQQHSQAEIIYKIKRAAEFEFIHGYIMYSLYS